MHKYLFFFLSMSLFVACHRGKKKAAHGKATPSEFFSSFSKLHLPYFVTDTSLSQHIDSTPITKEQLDVILPDSVSEMIINGGNAIHAVGRIDADSIRYLVISADRGRNFKWYALAFTMDNKYLSYIEVIDNKHEDHYDTRLTINKEPTFLIGRNKKSENGDMLYSNNGYGFNPATNKFMLVLSDSNEDLPKSDEIYNPIDTLPAKFAYSDDYKEDKKNFLALRDGKRPSEYIFFLHFDKTDEDPNCKGEMKGTVKMVSEKDGIYQQGGDPCVINFTLSKERISIKEQGNCANHRGSNVLFKDSYDKIVKKAKEQQQD